MIFFFYNKLNSRLFFILDSFVFDLILFHGPVEELNLGEGEVSPWTAITRPQQPFTITFTLRFTPSKSV